MKHLVTVILLSLATILLQSIYDPTLFIKTVNYLSQPYDIRGFAKGFIYFFTYLSAIATLIIILKIQSNKIFWFFLFLIFISYSIDLFIQFIGTSHGFSIAEYSLAVNEVSNAKYLYTYIKEIMYALGLSFLFIAFLYYMRVKRFKSNVSSPFLLLLFIPALAIYFSAAKISTIHLDMYPAYIKTPLISLRYHNIPHTLHKGILPKNIIPGKSSTINTIIWVVDESITGSYLSVNGYKKETTPYLKSLVKNSNIVSNFGIVNSISNCSAQSNFFLRIGVSPESNVSVRQSAYSLPTIFNFAKRAGYSTWLFDSQAGKDQLQDVLSIYDKKYIDHFETLDADVIPKERDRAFIDQITKIAKDKTHKNFIVIVKFGSHWPYYLAYDQKNATFEPALTSGFGSMEIEHKEEQINTYLNAIKYSTDDYLEKIISKLDLSDTLLFYTSDHGQNILEVKNMKRTHCNTENIVKNEVSVPLLVFHKNVKTLLPVKENTFYSQIQIFPTTLSLMGYDNTIVNSYGKTLQEGYTKSDDRKYFPLRLDKINIYK